MLNGLNAKTLKYLNAKMKKCRNTYRGKTDVGTVFVKPDSRLKWTAV